MSYYVSLISNVVDFVEENIENSLSLDDLAGEFSFSAFHFNRIFRSVTGQTLKQYILARKLTLAMQRLAAGSETVIKVACDFGFNSPEVFSRAFKKQFGISPNSFKQDPYPLGTVNKVSVIERDIINYQGKLALKGECLQLDEIRLTGTQVKVNVNQAGFEEILRNNSDGFYQEALQSGRFVTDRFYSVVNCLGEDRGDYNVFCGMLALSEEVANHFMLRSVPAGRYVKFLYTGDMFDIRSGFMDDLYRWVMVKDIKLEANGIGMLNIYKPDYPQTHEVEILVPVKSGQ